MILKKEYETKHNSACASVKSEVYRDIVYYTGSSLYRIGILRCGRMLHCQEWLNWNQEAEILILFKGPNPEVFLQVFFSFRGSSD